MECPICYSSKCSCTLACGHSFCHGCVKQWYTSTENEPSCPMCRKSMYFKGMHRVVDQWEKEIEEKFLDDIYDSIIENCADSMLLIRFLEKNFNRLKPILTLYSFDEAIELLCTYFGPLTYGSRYMIWDDWGNLDQRKHLMVSNYPIQQATRIFR